MYVIVDIQGQQFNVEQGRRLFIHHVKGAESGAVVEFDKVLLVDKDGAVTVGTPVVAGAKVVCEIITPLVKGDKVLVSTRSAVRAIASSMATASSSAKSSSRKS